jgi:hypothetical protein
MELHRLLLDAYESEDPDVIVKALDDHFLETERVVRDGFDQSGNLAVAAS